MTNEAIDHKALVSQLSDEQRVALTTPSDIAGMTHLLTHIVALAATTFWIAQFYALWQIVMVLQGIQLVFLFTLLHETVHDTPFASLRLNRAVGIFSGFLIFLPPLWFRYFHLAHHRHTHNPEKDPELEGDPIDTIPRYLWTVSGLPAWKFHAITLFQTAWGRMEYDYLPASVHARVRTEARLFWLAYALILGACLWAQTALLLYVWLLPLVLGQPFLRLYLMAEHGRCPHVANMLENTRTTFTNSLVRWLAWNMPYHAEHHAYPRVPFHKLPEFHKVAKEHLQVTENGYNKFQRQMIQTIGRASS
jgi:fatty acid desaturase